MGCNSRKKEKEEYLLGHLPGPSTGDPTHDKVMQRGLMGKASQASGGSPWVFLNIYPPKPESACFITVLFTLLTLWKKVN